MQIPANAKRNLKEYCGRTLVLQRTGMEDSFNQRVTDSEAALLKSMKRGSIEEDIAFERREDLGETQ